MSQYTDLKRIERNVFRDTLRDGLPDLFIGCVLLMEGGILGGLSPACIPFIVIFGPAILIALRRRLTYPRIGYVELATGESKHGLCWLLGFGLAIVAVFVAVLLISGDIRDAALWYRWMPIPFGLVFTIGFAIAVLKSRLVRFYFYAALAVAGGAVFPFLPLTGKLEALSLYLVFLGLPILLCGAVVFALFLRRNPVQPTEVTDEH